MSTDATTRDQAVPTTRLWVGVVASTVAWFGLGLADMFITWRACVHQEQFGGPSSHPVAQILFYVSGFSLLALAVIAGVISYRSWQTLSQTRDLLEAEAVERKEFMALAGLFMCFTLGAGLVWLCLPPFILEMCLRTR
jgi:hypothetical protein